MINAGIVIGRFQPFHNGHLRILEHALDVYDKVVVVLGSHNSLRTIKNPWTAQEREIMIREAIRNSRKVRFHYQEDRQGDYDRWVSEIKTGVGTLVWDFTETINPVLVGSFKDESSFYLRLFSNWPAAQLGVIASINATDIRKLYFNRNALETEWTKNLPISSIKFLNSFKDTNLYKELSTRPS